MEDSVALPPPADTENGEPVPIESVTSEPVPIDTENDAAPPVDTENSEAMPVDAADGEPEPKRRKAVNASELNLLENLPAAERYERSYMHRDNVQFVHCTNRTFFVITASIDGHIKFWKKREGGIEFVKHYRAHLGNLISADASHDGIRYASCANDKKLKIFDVINFDMINMISLEFLPSIVRWIYSAGSTVMSVAVAEAAAHVIRIYDSTSSTGVATMVLDQLHNDKATVTTLCFSSELRIVCSADSQGMIEFWRSESPHRYIHTLPSIPRIRGTGLDLSC